MKLNNEIDEFENISKKIRKHILRMTLYSKSSHIGAAFSTVEIMVALYFKILKTDQSNNNLNRDRFILSKAHASAALYAILAEKESLPDDCL